MIFRWRTGLNRFPLSVSGLCTIMVLAGSFGGAAQAQLQAPFTEVALNRGIVYATGQATFGYGVSIVDLDNDGDLDMVAIGNPNGVVGIFRNNGSAHFTQMPVDPSTPRVMTASGVAAADYDGDGDLDIYISATGGTNVLLRNNGQLQFTDVTSTAGVGDPSGIGYGVAWGDMDNDGWIDLFVSNYTQPGASPSRMYLNLGNGTFVDILDSCGIVDFGMTFGGTFFDWDLDGDSDLYVSNDRCGTGQGNRLWENIGGTFIDATDASGSGACIWSMGVATGDFDGDQLKDIYITNLSFQGNKLFLNQGDRTFLESSQVAGVESFEYGWGAIFFDYDNDSHQELFVNNAFGPNKMYDHDGVWPSQEIAATLAITEYSRNSFGVAVGDLDLDGDRDLVISNKNERIRVFLNQEGQTRQWVRMKVEGSGPNTFAIGANVDIRTGTRRQTREVVAGSSYLSQDPYTLHFGLDTATVVDEIQVYWPGGKTRTLTNLSSNNTWTLYPAESLGDGDHDGDTDIDDLPILAGCMAALSFEPGCEIMDLDGNGSVTGDDFSEFVRRYNGPFFDCDANGTMDSLDIVGLAPGGGVPFGCQIFDPSLGGVPNGVLIAGQPLILGKLGDGGVRLEWSHVCDGIGTDYAVYQGTVGNFGSHLPLVCSTGGATIHELPETGGNRYYLIVPTNSVREGSYGVATGGERPPAAGSCYTQAIASCE